MAARDDYPWLARLADNPGLYTLQRSAEALRAINEIDALRIRLEKLRVYRERVEGR